MSDKEYIITESYNPQERVDAFQKLEPEFWKHKKLEEMSKEQEGFLQNSFVSHKVQHSVFGEGIIIEQREDMITVSFSKAGLAKSFLIHRKYTNRPQFEKDEETIAAFSDFVDGRQSSHLVEQEKIRLEKQLAELIQEYNS